MQLRTRSDRQIHDFSAVERSDLKASVWLEEIPSAGPSAVHPGYIVFRLCHPTRWA